MPVLTLIRNHLFPFKISASQTENQVKLPESILSSAPKTPTEHTKRPSALRSRGTESATPQLGRASDSQQAHSPPPNTSTKKKWRLSIRGFLTGDDGRLISVEEIVPVTPTTPAHSARQTKLPIYVAEMQGTEPYAPMRRSSLDHNPGHKALYALQELTGNGNGYPRVWSTPAGGCVYTQLTDDPVPAGSVTQPPSPIAAAIDIIASPPTEQVKSTASVNFSHPLPPAREHRTPSPAPSSVTSDRGVASFVSQSPASTSASTTSWQTEEGAQCVLGGLWREPAITTTPISKGATDNGGQDQDNDMKVLMYETRDEQPACRPGQLDTITEEERETPSPQDRFDIPESDITTETDDVFDRLYRDALIRMQNRDAIAGCALEPY